VRHGQGYGFVMIAAMLGKKIGMTRVFDPEGASVPVTLVQAGPCTVLQVRTQDKDRYDAVQLGFDDVKATRAKFPAIGHARRANATPKRFVREIRLAAATEVKQGDVLTVEEFEKRGIAYVDVVGTTRGFGFQGVMKRHHFGGQPGSHGTERKHRSPGGIGGMAGDRGRGRSVKKGKRMAGHMGAARRTTRNQRLIQIDKDKNLLVIEGAIPGPRGGYVIVRESKTKKARPEKK
jgi:large subunit ribosomal protein L3